jgi:hypothetical protein
MKATELRIGNWVELIGFGNKKCDALLITEQDQSNKSGHKYLNPIPLTEEWLIKLGFISYDSVFGIEYKIAMDVEPSYILGKRNRELTASPDGEKYFIDGNYLIRIKYVHQLQNLYFALTGEELETKEA